MSDPQQGVTAYIGLGSNLQNPIMQVKSALRELAELEESAMLCHSSLYRSQPVGPQDQPDFINAVAKLATRLGAEALLNALQTLERSHHRVREQHWGPRSLDLDLLLYGTESIGTARLQVPHPEIGRRDFVLVPLREIAPADLPIPGLGCLKDIKIASKEGSIERLP